mmetsp:Transcript_62997/g.147929  ORF Transcript_62997/g.147929 Transcript_62997/m.147929 type:complete len:86 (-) Transcript_62997:882-1139(-)
MPAMANADRIWHQGTTPLRNRSKSKNRSRSLRQRFLDRAAIFDKTSWQEMRTCFDLLGGAVCGLVGLLGLESLRCAGRPGCAETT